MSLSKHEPVEAWPFLFDSLLIDPTSADGAPPPARPARAARFAPVPPISVGTGARRTADRTTHTGSLAAPVFRMDTDRPEGYGASRY